MRRFLTQKKVLLLVFVIVIFLTQLAIFSHLRDASRSLIAWPISGLRELSNSIGDTFKLWRTITELSEENMALKQKNNELSAAIARLETVAIENSQLRKDLAFQDQNRQLTLIPATLIGSLPGASYQVFMISKGSQDGIFEGQAVVSQGHLIGQVRKVSPDTAEVWHISNRNKLTPVILTQSQTTGILRGGIRGLIVENIPADAPVNRGESVTTSALEGIYPAGILVGQIEEIISKKEDIFLTVRVISPINIAALTTVFVVKES